MAEVWECTRDIKWSEPQHNAITRPLEFWEERLCTVIISDVSLLGDWLSEGSRYNTPCTG